MSDKVLTLTDSEQDLEESLTVEEEESSDDEGLNAKLCSFTVTQKTFIHQYWYAGQVLCTHICMYACVCACVCVHVCVHVCVRMCTVCACCCVLACACPSLLLPCRYHCYTCGLAENTGVCSICAKVCHKEHELAYSKYGAFFCDCGARGEAHCKVSGCMARIAARTAMLVLCDWAALSAWQLLLCVSLHTTSSPHHPTHFLVGLDPKSV